MSPPAPDPQAVFLNIPYDKAFEALFVTMVVTLTFLGQKPRCVLEIQEMGQGRLARIRDLMTSCRVSLHDLSRQGRPPRFNMPFELGLASSLQLSGVPHEVVVLDSRPFRLDKALSDYKGRDPLIHQNKCDVMISCLLDLYDVPNEPSPSEMRREARYLRSVARTIVDEWGTGTIFRRKPFKSLVEAATRHALDKGFILA